MVQHQVQTARSGNADGNVEEILHSQLQGEPYTAYGGGGGGGNNLPGDPGGLVVDQVVVVLQLWRWIE